MQKAYKLLSLQHNISHNQAKSLIDRGLVSVKGKRLELARVQYCDNTIFDIEFVDKPRIIFNDEHILCVDKPAFMESYELERYFKGWVLLNRLDKQTSGVILLVKPNSEFSHKAKEEFKKRHVLKMYNAIVSGIVVEDMEINAPILTKKGKTAKSKIHKNGLEARTLISPKAIIGKKTLLDIIIHTGRTHQIRIHLAHIGHPILGDSLYGGTKAKRLMLHAHKIGILEYEFSSPLPAVFNALF